MYYKKTGIIQQKGNACFSFDQLLFAAKYGLSALPRLKASLLCTLHCSVHVNIAKLLAYLLIHATIQPTAMSHAS